MPGRSLRVLLAVLAAVAATAAAWWFLLREPPGPPEAEGRAWLAGFVDTLAGADTWGARGADAVARFPGLGPAATEGSCQLEWSLRNPSAPIVTFQRLELGRLGNEPCGEAQFGLVSTTLRQSDGVGAGRFVELFSDRFGPPDTSRGSSTDDSVHYTWQILDGVFATLEEPVGRRGGRDFHVLFVRSLGTPAALPTPAQAEAWMDRTVELVTGPALLRARGPEAAGLLGVAMQPQMPDEAGCATTFAADPAHPGLIGTGQDLFLERAEGEECAQARVSHFSMRVWQRDPVSARTLVERIGRRLGEPIVSRSFNHGGVEYEWHTEAGTRVWLFEGVSGGRDHSLLLSMSRS